jgi:hypothetical protein
MIREDIQYYREQLALSEARMMRLQKEGVGALSRYDVEIASGGDAALALQTAKRWVGNNIRYYTEKIAELEKRPKQLGIFKEQP